MLSHSLAWLPWLPHQQYFSWIQTKTNKAINVELRGEVGEGDTGSQQLKYFPGCCSQVFLLLLNLSFKKFIHSVFWAQLSPSSITSPSHSQLLHTAVSGDAYALREIVRYLAEELLKLMSGPVIALACSSTIHFIFTWISHFSNGMEPYNVGIWAQSYQRYWL